MAEFQRFFSRARKGVVRWSIGAVAAVMLVPLAISGASAQGSGAAQRIADHFAGIPSMHGDFIQFDPNGRQSEGKFYIERPGKVRFDYANAPLRVIADGSTVAINNKKLNTWDTYPLSKTPMKLLLDRRIDLSSANIRSVKEEPDLTTIVMGDRSVFGSSYITMMFDPESYDLKQWTIRDQQGKETTVMIYNVKTGGNIQDSAFKIPYTAISQGQTGNR